MHKKKNQLFRIIRSLKPTEKAYFKKFGYKQDITQSVILSLFELADKQLKGEGEFEEAKLIRSFEKKYPNQNYTKIKSRLLEQVLDALRDYDKKHSEVEKIYDYLAYAESLKKRELFFDAWNILHRAEKLAEELELIELLILIQSKKYYYEIFTQNYQAKYTNNETIERILQYVDFLRDRIISDLAAYRILHFQKSIGIPRSAEDLELLKEIREHPSFGDDYVPQLESSKLNLAVAKSGIFFSIGDVPSVIKVSEKLIDQFQPSDKLRRLTSSKYLSLFDSFLQATLLSLNIPLFEQYYPVFTEVKTYGEDDRNLKMGIDLYARSIYAIVGDKPDLVPSLIAEFNQIKEKSYIPNYRKISLAYYMSFAPFLNGDYSAALDQIQWIRNNRQLGLRYDIEVGILGMECMVLIERSEFDLLEYRLRSFDEFLKKNGRKFEVEAAVIRLVRRSLGASGPEALMDVYRESLAQMRNLLSSNPAENAFLQAFDIVSWLESKIDGGTFKDAYYRNNIPS